MAISLATILLSEQAVTPDLRRQAYEISGAANQVDFMERVTQQLLQSSQQSRPGKRSRPQSP